MLLITTMLLPLILQLMLALRPDRQWGEEPDARDPRLQNGEQSQRQRSSEIRS